MFPIGPSSDNVEEDMIAASRGASATVLEESRKETTPVQLPVSGPELAAMMKIGTRVMRGVDWKWGDQVQNCVPLLFCNMSDESTDSINGLVM